jgi:hypothetical protein
MSREVWAARKRALLERQRLYLQGICHDVPVWPELARRVWRCE